MKDLSSKQIIVKWGAVSGLLGVIFFFNHRVYWTSTKSIGAIFRFYNSYCSNLFGS